MTVDRPRLMAVHGYAKGIGYVVFEGQALFDWGTIVARGDKNAMSLRKLIRLLDRFSPETLALEAAEQTSRRSERIQTLHRAIVELCRSRNIDVEIMAQSEIHRCLDLTPPVTRQDAAEVVARLIPVLSPRLPNPRKPWQSEPRRMAMFSAAAVALCSLRRPFGWGSDLEPSLPLP